MATTGDITKVREESGSPFNYGVPGWSHNELEPDGKYSWKGVKVESAYGQDSTLFLTDIIDEDVTLKVDFTIESIVLDHEAVKAVEEGKDGIYFTYYDSELGALQNTFYNTPQVVSRTIKQGKVLWPTSNVTSQGGFIISPETLQQFYFLPSISMGTAISCVIGEITAQVVTVSEEAP